MWLAIKTIALKGGKVSLHRVTLSRVDESTILINRRLRNRSDIEDIESPAMIGTGRSVNVPSIFLYGSLLAISPRFYNVLRHVISSYGAIKLRRS